MTEPTNRKNHLVVEEYRRLAPDYDSRWAFYIDATLRETLARLRLPGEARVLDLGCGTGQLLAALAERYPDARLTGIDPVPEMLEQARHRLPVSAALHVAWAEALPLADQSCDVVVSCNMFHYIDQPDRALREVRRVLRPGGRVLITDWCDDYWTCWLCDRYLRLVNRAHRPIYGTARCRDLVARAGFTDLSIDRYKVSWLWGMMTLEARTPVRE